VQGIEGVFAAALVAVVSAYVGYLAWTFAWARIDRPRQLRRSLRPIARCLLTEKLSLRELAPVLAEAIKVADRAISADRSNRAQPSLSLVLFEDGRPRAFLLLLRNADGKSPGRSERREVEVEIRSGYSAPPAPRLGSSRRVLDAVWRALHTMSNVESARWTRDRATWFDAPFDAQR
jgi:hypothetical protein